MTDTNAGGLSNVLAEAKRALYDFEQAQNAVDETPEQQFRTMPEPHPGYPVSAVPEREQTLDISGQKQGLVTPPPRHVKSPSVHNVSYMPDNQG